MDDKALLKETLSLLQLLKSDDKKHSDYFYYEGLEDFSRVQCFSFDEESAHRQMHSKEFCTADWFILYTLLITRIATADDIVKILYTIKKKNPKLAISYDRTFIRKRINGLLRKGYISRVQYIQNSDKSMDDACLLLDQMAEMSKEEDREMDVDDVQSLDDLIGGFHQSEESEAYLDNSYVVDMRKKNALFSMLKENNGLYDGANYQNFFGKNAVLKNGYFLNNWVFPVLGAYFNATPVAPLKNVDVKMFYAKVGMMLASKVTAMLYELPTFYKTKNALVKSKVSTFNCLAETEFKCERNGQDFRYFGAVFSCYSYCDERVMLEDVEKKNLFDVVNNVKNYIGIKGINKMGKDAFVILVVNDIQDLNKFATAALRLGLTDEEKKRLFITGDGILNVCGLSKMLHINTFVDGKPSYIPASLPIL